MSGTKSVAIVTGASQGIGRATALRLARDFSVIVLVARHEDKLEKTVADVMFPASAEPAGTQTGARLDGQDFETSQVEVAGNRKFVRRYGNGPPIF